MSQDPSPQLKTSPELECDYTLNHGFEYLATPRERRDGDTHFFHATLEADSRPVKPRADLFLKNLIQDSSGVTCRAWVRLPRKSFKVAMVLEAIDRVLDHPNGPACETIAHEGKRWTVVERKAHSIPRRGTQITTYISNMFIGKGEKMREGKPVVFHHEEGDPDPSLGWARAQIAFLQEVRESVEVLKNSHRT